MNSNIPPSLLVSFYSNVLPKNLTIVNTAILNHCREISGQVITDSRIDLFNEQLLSVLIFYVYLIVGYLFRLVPKQLERVSFAPYLPSRAVTSWARSVRESYVLFWFHIKCCYCFTALLHTTCRFVSVRRKAPVLMAESILLLWMSFNISKVNATRYKSWI